MMPRKETTPQRPEPAVRKGEPPRVPKVQQPDPRSPQFREEAREEAAKEKLDP